MKRPLVFLTALFCAGIFIAQHSIKSFALCYLCAVISSIAGWLSIRRKLLFAFCLSCLSLFLGASLLKDYQILPQTHIAKYAPGKNYIIQGVIQNEPVLKNKRRNFLLRAEKIGFDNLAFYCSGNLFVSANVKKDLAYGEEIILTGSLFRTANLSSTRKGFAYYLISQNIYSIMNVKHENNIIKLQKNKGSSLKAFSFWIKHKAQDIIAKHFTKYSGGVLEAMVLGEKKNLSVFINQAMMQSGTVHILVVSGFNVGIVAFIIMMLLKLLRVTRRIRLSISIPLLVFYCLVSGASTPVVRATLMAIIFILAHIAKREPSIDNATAIAALIILWNNPGQLFDIGFQLSFVSVLSIIYLYPRAKLCLSLDKLRIKCLRYLVDGCLLSLSTWAGTMGFIAYYFRIFSPITVVANLCIVPLATLITLCGFSVILLTFIFPAVVPFVALSSKLAVALLVKINSLLLQLPGAYFYLK